MTRIGDLTVEERCNLGISELSDFFPGGPTQRDCHIAITSSSPMRRTIYLGETGDTPGVAPGRAPGQSSRRDSEYMKTLNIPDYVVSSYIEMGDRIWDYRTEMGGVGSLRRVFILKDQALHLDIDETLVWLSANPRTERHELVKSQLEAEASMENMNNQVIMQQMYDRVMRKEAMLPNSSKIPVKQE